MIDILKNILWIIVTFFLIINGVYFTWNLKGKQFRLITMIKQIIKKEDNMSGSGSFTSLMLSLAGRIGVGSISGVALAIYLAGPGTIFWIWIISFISAILGYVESYLGVKYKEKNRTNEYLGGPSFYIKKGLKKPRLGIIYAVMIIICYCGGFMLIQANTITKATITLYKNTSPLLIGIVLSILTWIVIFGGIKTVTKATSKIVPIMSLGYVGLAFFIMISNWELIPIIFKKIITDAFTYKSFFSGFLSTMIIGVQRGIFSNEGGIGTGSMAAAISGSDNLEGQGLVQVVGIYVTTFLICTSTAIIILTSNYRYLNLIDPNGIELAIVSFNEHLGSFGKIYLIGAIFLFAFSTILSGYFYGETCLRFLFKSGHEVYLKILKVMIGIIIFIGTIISSELLWELTDILIAILALINIYALYKLRFEIIK